MLEDINLLGDLRNGLSVRLDTPAQAIHEATGVVLRATNAPFSVISDDGTVHATGYLSGDVDPSCATRPQLRIVTGDDIGAEPENADDYTAVAFAAAVVHAWKQADSPKS